MEINPAATENLDSWSDRKATCSSKQTCETRNKLSYTRFPVKLHRIVSEDKYDAIWWDEGGSHFIVNVPRFEKEFLRSNSIPENDGFKTITFTSLIRQLNLYGFRKVAIVCDAHVDPSDWQRYAHPYFQRGRTDYLHRIKRQIPLQTLKRRPTQMKDSFFWNGIRPSRKGPKPNRNFSFQTFQSQSKQVIGPIINYQPRCNTVMFNFGSFQQSLKAYALPTMELVEYGGSLYHPCQALQIESAFRPMHTNQPEIASFYLDELSTAPAAKSPVFIHNRQDRNWKCDEFAQSSQHQGSKHYDDTLTKGHELNLAEEVEIAGESDQLEALTGNDVSDLLSPMCSNIDDLDHIKLWVEGSQQVNIGLLTDHVIFGCDVPILQG